MDIHGRVVQIASPGPGWREVTVVESDPEALRLRKALIEDEFLGAQQFLGSSEMEKTQQDGRWIFEKPGIIWQADARTCLTLEVAPDGNSTGDVPHIRYVYQKIEKTPFIKGYDLETIPLYERKVIFRAGDMRMHVKRPWWGLGERWYSYGLSRMMTIHRPGAIEQGTILEYCKGDICDLQVMTLYGPRVDELSSLSFQGPMAIPDGRRGWVIRKGSAMVVVNAPDERMLRKAHDALRLVVPK